MDQPHYPIDRFDPLLRDLLWWGLVRPGRPPAGAGRSGAGTGHWVLSEEAQRRLTELAPRLSQPQTDRVLYLDRMCTECHQRVPTRLVDGLFLCDACRRRAQAGPAPDPAPDPAPAQGSPPGDGSRHEPAAPRR
jgi:hypothetical protein